MPVDLLAPLVDQLVVPFEDPSILSMAVTDVDLNGSLAITLLGDPMTKCGTSSREVFVDSTRTVVIKVEHTYGAHQVQCWNEYVFYGEYMQGTHESKLLVPTLELHTLPCPVERHSVVNKCHLVLNVQEYINDGFAADGIFPLSGDHDPNPWEDCIKPLLRVRPELAGDLSEGRDDQTRYCMQRGRYVLVDYGVPRAFGQAIDSAYYEYPEWREEHGAPR